MPIPEVPNIRSDRLNFNSTNEIPRVGTNGPSIIPTINPPVIENTPPPVIRGLELPVFRAPDTRIPYPVIQVPTQEEFDAAVKADREKAAQENQEKTRSLPDAKPSDLGKMSQQLPPSSIPKEESSTTSTPPKETNIDATTITVPYIGEIPVPSTQTVVLSGTTATASVAAALIGKSLVEQLVKILKPIIEQMIVRAKKLLNQDLTPYETQMLFAVELDKKTLKLLKKEQKQAKKEQMKRWEGLKPHQRKFWHKVTVDENKSHPS